jgi:hypothetical protein
MAAAASFSTLVGRIAHILGDGFRRRGPQLYRHEARGHWAIVEFQKSRQSTSEITIFTVNVGIASDLLLDFFSSIRRTERVPFASEWHWRQRLGALLPTAQDVWWSLTAGEQVEQLATELSGLLTDFALPPLNKYVDDRALIELWLTGQSPGLTDLQRLRNLAVLLHSTSDLKRYESALAELARSSPATATFVSKKLAN